MIYDYDHSYVGPFLGCKYIIVKTKFYVARVEFVLKKLTFIMFHNDTFTSQLYIILKMKLMESRHILLLIFAKNEKFTCSGAKIQPLEIDHKILTENL